MKYTLMHKNVEVADIEIGRYAAEISHIEKHHAIEHLPVGVSVRRGVIDLDQLNDWWIGRSIPASRQGIREVLEALSISTTKLLIEKCMGLSLSDQYWIRPVDKAIQWSDVNFFENAFSEDVGTILFGGKVNKGAVNLMSPDNTSDGWLKKKWIIADGKRVLVKGGSGGPQQEPLNEAVATELMRRLDIPHVPYAVMFDGRSAFSICENFITPQTELVSAYRILHTQKKANHTSVYQHFLNCCDALGISGAEDAVVQMLAVDYLIVNEDRHFNNFGAVRNAETLEWIGMAPIFDSGTSMWFDALNHWIGRTDAVKSKPFRSTHGEQIKLVKSLDFIDFSKLTDISDAANEIYKQSPFISIERRELLCGSLEKRVKMLSQIRDSRATKKPSLLAELDENKRRIADNRKKAPPREPKSGEPEL